MEGEPYLLWPLVFQLTMDIIIMFRHEYNQVLTGAKRDKEMKIIDFIPIAFEFVNLEVSKPSQNTLLLFL